MYKVWTGKQERETGSGPVAPLEERAGFLDIRVCTIEKLGRLGSGMLIAGDYRQSGPSFRAS